MDTDIFYFMFCRQQHTIKRFEISEAKINQNALWKKISLKGKLFKLVIFKAKIFRVYYCCWNFNFGLDIASGMRQVNSIKSDCSAMLDQNMQGRKLKIRFLVMVCKTSCCASSLPISDVNSLRNITPAVPHESSLSPPS